MSSWGDSSEWSTIVMKPNWTKILASREQSSSGYKQIVWPQAYISCHWKSHDHVIFKMVIYIKISSNVPTQKCPDGFDFVYNMVLLGCSSALTFMMKTISHLIWS